MADRTVLGAGPGEVPAGHEASVIEHAPVGVAEWSGTRAYART